MNIASGKNDGATHSNLADTFSNYHEYTVRFLFFFLIFYNFLIFARTQ